MRILFIVFGLILPALIEAETLTQSQRIDALVEAALEKQGIQPNREITDEVFLRRAYLDIAGRIPTIEEAEAFHADSYPNKREKLIDSLIHSEGYVSNAYHFWADLLRINGEPGGAVGDAYELWVKDALRKNMPYDEMVYSLVTAEGKIWENGAVGYYFRDRGMPLDNMSNTVRIFLGTRLECAQCHNHPFDKWTQMDYFKMASFSYGMNTRNYDAPNREMVSVHLKKAGEEAYLAKAKELTGKDDFPNLSKRGALARYIETAPEKSPEASVKEVRKGQSAVKKKKERQKRSRLTLHETMGMSKSKFVKVVEKCIAAAEETSADKEAIRELLSDLYNPLQYVNVTETDRDAKLPHDYQYSDANPEDLVPASTMFGAEIDLSTEASKIDGYGKWMTSPENPTFTKVIANRLWKEVFGQGIFEPVDELTEQTSVSNPELLSYLEDLMRELKYDQKAFQKILYNTRTYQRGSFTGEVVMGAPYYFQGPLLRRMSAEQIWDSLVALALPEADLYQPKVENQLASIDKVRRIYSSLEERPFEEFIAMVNELAPLISGQREQADKFREEMNEARAADDMERFQELRRSYGENKKSVEKKISDVAFIHLQEKVESGDLLLAMGIMDVGSSAMLEEDSADNSGSQVLEIMTKLPKAEMGELPEELQATSSDKRANKAAQKAWYTEQKNDYNVYRKLVAGMARASELPSPAKRGHFLRDFGQSDREVIENASGHASVPQALNLLNGPIVESLTNRYSVFGKRVHGAGDPDEKARMIFQAMLTREPTEEELAIVRAEVKNGGDEAYEGIVWALLNTQQFLFVQ